MKDLGKLMKQAQEMQSKMQEAQEKLDDIRVTGEAGAGMVQATATAKGEVVGLTIDPSLFNPDDKEVVEDLIVAAIREAQEKGKELSSRTNSLVGPLTRNLFK